MSREASPSEEGQLRMQGPWGTTLDIPVSLDAGPSPAELLLWRQGLPSIVQVSLPHQPPLHRRFFPLDDLPHVPGRGKTDLGPPVVNAQAQALSFKRDTGILAHRLIQNDS